MERNILLENSQDYIDCTPKYKIDPMQTWPVTRLPKGQSPPGGRLQRSTRLRKKFHKWWIQKIVPPINVGKAVDQMVKMTRDADWSAIGRAMKIMEESLAKESRNTYYTNKLMKLSNETLGQRDDT